MLSSDTTSDDYWEFSNTDTAAYEGPGGKILTAFYDDGAGMGLIAIMSHVPNDLTDPYTYSYYSMIDGGISPYGGITSAKFTVAQLNNGEWVDSGQGGFTFVDRSS